MLLPLSNVGKELFVGIIKAPALKVLSTRGNHESTLSNNFEFPTLLVIEKSTLLRLDEGDISSCLDLISRFGPSERTALFCAAGEFLNRERTRAPTPCKQAAMNRVENSFDLHSISFCEREIEPLLGRSVHNLTGEIRTVPFINWRSLETGSISSEMQD